MKSHTKTRPVRGLSGEVRVGADKSISHRALIFAALASGTSRIRNLLTGEDVKSTLSILRGLGVETSHDAGSVNSETELLVQGRGLMGLQAPTSILDCGNSGTSMRLMLGLLAAQKFSSQLTGDSSLNRRPMERVTQPLSLMGGRFAFSESAGRRIISVKPAASFQGINYNSPVASAQVKSCLLLAGLYAEGTTRITEPSQSRDHSELMLTAMGAAIQVEQLTVTISPGQLKPIDISIPGDISSAAFFMVAALITPDSDVMIRNIGLNPTRTGLLDVLIAMGGDITIESQYLSGGEVVGDVRFKSSKLRNLSVSGDIVPRLIDEIPILALAATQASGRMVLSEAGELRVKETDRIRALATELNRLGAMVTETTDGLIIEGGAKLVAPQSLMRSYGDHRMAMMEAIAGGILSDGAQIDDTACVNTSFPEFFSLLADLSG